MAYKGWPALKKGSRVAVVAPSFGCPRADLSSAAALLESWGLKAHIPDNILGDDLLCANTDAIRFELLKEALLDESIHAVWCIRGGCGATKLLPMLSTLTPPARPKLFIGFSDITAIHTFLQQHWGWQTLHGPSLRQVAQKKIPERDIEAVRRIMFGESLEETFTLIPLNTRMEEVTSLRSSIVGGNLSLVQANIGTPWQLHTDHKILFLEDAHEHPYRIDRTLEHLRQAKLLDSVQAVIFGDFTEDGKPVKQNPLMDKVLRRFAEACAFPVFRLPGIGHGDCNFPLPLGAESSMTRDKLVIHLESRVPVV